MAGGRVQSIWTRPQRAGRGPAPRHSTVEIARAAVSLADAKGLAAVTMRAVAATIGTAPASLYRYVNTRGDLLELMVDQVAGEYTVSEPYPGRPVAGLLALAHQTLAIYRKHPWLLDIPPAGGLPGPNALAFMEQTLAILRDVDLSGAAKLEVIGLFTATVRSFAHMEAEQRRAGRDIAGWQAAVAGYLLQVAATGQHPYLANALTTQPPDPRPGPEEPLFDRAMTRILTGLLPSARPTAARTVSMGGPQLNLLVLYTADVANCRAFYEQFGLEFTAERHGGGPEHVAACLADGTVLEIYPAGRKTPTGPLRIGLTLAAGRRGCIHLSGQHLLRDPDGRAVEVTVS